MAGLTELTLNIRNNTARNIVSLANLMIFFIAGAEMRISDMVIENCTTFDPAFYFGWLATVRIDNFYVRGLEDRLPSILTFHLYYIPIFH